MMYGFHRNFAMAWPIILAVLIHHVTAAALPAGQGSPDRASKTPPQEYSTVHKEDKKPDTDMKSEEIFSLDGTHTVRQISYDEKNIRHQHEKLENSKHSTKIGQDGQFSQDINPHKYEYSINEPSLCGADTYLLIVVCSSIQNFESREAIRNTWGKSPGPKTQLLFLLGEASENLSDSQKIHTKIKEESKKYHDIIQEDFIDSYKNLTLKSVAMLKWVDTWCSGVKYVLKTDDDQFINVPLLLRDLQNSVHARFIMGNIIAGAQPITDRNSKYYTPKSLFSDPMFPKYMSGSAYVISGDIIHDLYQATLHTKLFWLEDIYITGLCARKIGAIHIYNGKFGYRKRVLDPCLFRLVITGHRLLSEELRGVWERLADPTLTCSHRRINPGNKL